MVVHEKNMVIFITIRGVMHEIVGHRIEITAANFNVNPLRVTFLSRMVFLASANI